MPGLQQLNDSIMPILGGPWANVWSDLELEQLALTSFRPNNAPVTPSHPLSEPPESGTWPHPESAMSGSISPPQS